jgi:DNA topoisomerase-1
VIRDGRYGPYCSDGTTHASLPKGSKVAEFTFDEAVRMLAEKRAAGPRPKRRGGPSSRSSRSGGARKKKAPARR